MKISRLALLLCALLALALAAAGCGAGDEDVPADAVAVVDGEEIAKSDYDALIAQAKKSYANQKREFPKAGSQEFQTLRNQAVQFLIQREQFEQEAEDLEVEVTDKQIDARLGADYLVYRGGRATVGPLVLGSAEIKALRDVSDTAVYTSAKREVSLRTEEIEGAVGLVDAIVVARQAA